LKFGLKPCRRQAQGLAVALADLDEAIGVTGMAMDATRPVDHAEHAVVSLTLSGVSTATAVKPGFFSNWRKANLRSFIYDFG
jgi:hypothetical protein